VEGLVDVGLAAGLEDEGDARVSPFVVAEHSLGG
jgi:hypothetical protein